MNIKLVVISVLIITIVLVAVGYFLLTAREELVDTGYHSQVVKQDAVIEAQQTEEFEPLEERKKVIKKEAKQVESNDKKPRSEYNDMPPMD